MKGGQIKVFGVMVAFLAVVFLVSNAVGSGTPPQAGSNFVCVVDTGKSASAHVVVDRLYQLVFQNLPVDVKCIAFLDKVSSVSWINSFCTNGSGIGILLTSFRAVGVSRIIITDHNLRGNTTDLDKQLLDLVVLKVIQFNVTYTESG